MPDPALRVLLVDDEPLARSRLRTLLQACSSPPAQVVGEAARGSEALQWLQGPQGAACDVVLLDIQMPGLDGLGLAEALRQRSGPAVVFVTAHAGHALRAFEIDAVDYLTKPVRQERLQAALARVASRRAPPVPIADEGPQPQVIVVNDRGRVVRIPVDEVLYLKAELKYVTLRTAERAWLLDESLAELEPRLAQRFIRVHRNALVARHAVRRLERRMLSDDRAAAERRAGSLDAVETWAVQVAPVDEWLMVSRRQLAAVRDALTQGSTRA